MTKNSERPGKHPARGGLVSHEPILLTQPAPADGCSADERSVSTETTASEFAAPREIQARAPFDLVIRRNEEWISKAESDRTGNDGESKIEKIRDRRDGPTDQPSGSFDDLGRCLSRGTTGERRYCRPGCFSFKTTSSTAPARPSFGLDANVPDMSGVPIGAVKQSTIEHDATPNPG